METTATPLSLPYWACCVNANIIYARRINLSASSNSGNATYMPYRAEFVFQQAVVSVVYNKLVFEWMKDVDISIDVYLEHLFNHLEDLPVSHQVLSKPIITCESAE